MILAWTLAAGNPELAEGQLLNPDFSVASETDPTLPAGWFVGGEGYEVALDPLARRGARSIRMTRLAPGSFGVARQELPEESVPAAGSVVRVGGWIRTEGVEGGYAGFWVRADGVDLRSFILDNMNGRGVSGTEEWTYRSASILVPRSVRRIVVGALHTGAGTAWFDDLDITVESPGAGFEDARPLAETGLSNLIAFTRLLGYIRYFHASDEAATADWDRVAVEGARAVESADSPQALAAALDSIFRPLAPTLTLLVQDAFVGAPDPSGSPSGVPPPEGVEILYWQHSGVTTGGPQGPYRSDRVRSPLGNVPLPSSIPDPRVPWIRELTSGVWAALPLSVYSDGQRTLPPGGMTEASQADAYRVSGDDRGTRLGAIALLWSTLRHFYPYFDVGSGDWEAELPRALQAAAEDPDTCAFTRTLERLVAALEDGHGSVQGPCAALPGHPPFALEWVEGRPTVTHVSDEASPIRRGDLILAVDGRPAAELALELGAGISASASQWREARLAGVLLAGALGTEMILEVEGGNGDRVTIEVPRSSQGPPQVPGLDVIEEIEAGIWYVDLRRVTAATFREALDDLTNATGIVFELRGYPTGAAVEILTHLIDAPRTSAQWHIPIAVRPEREGGEFYRAPGWDLRPAEPRLQGPIVFLTDGRAISYAESIMGIVEAYGLGTIVGGPTAATNGNVIRTELPGGYSVSWTGMKVLKHDGSRHHGIGILPDVPATRTRAGVAAGRDEVLERGLEVIRAGGGG